MKRTDMEDWKRIGEQAKKARNELFKLLRMLSGKVPKTLYGGDFDRVLKYLDRMKSDLEDRMAEEHPKEWSTDTFYGDRVCFHCHKRKADAKFDHTDLEGLCRHCFENELRHACSHCRAHLEGRCGGEYVFKDEEVPKCYEN